MRDFYPQNQKNVSLKLSTAYSKMLKVAIVFALVFSCQTFKAQTVYTVVEGEQQTMVQGISPLATSINNQRSQYLYVGSSLVQQGATEGLISAIAIKITQVSPSENLYPTNLNIKLGATNLVELPTTMIPNLAVHYSASEEVITQNGWHTFNLQTPFSWDGSSNIIVEFCRTNELTGDGYEVEVYLGALGEYRTTGIYSDTENGNGCTLEGVTPITLPNRRLLPSMQMTMLNPCSGTPNPGTMQVSAGDNYCSAPFTITATDDSQQSGLSYQWQSNLYDNAQFVDIPGATAATLTTTQEFSTYYRRGVVCDESQSFVYPPAIYVDGSDCEEYLSLNDFNLNSNSIVVISNEKEVKVRSTAEPIEEIKIFDLRGRILYQKKSFSDLYLNIQLQSTAAQLLIVEVTTVSGYKVVKKVSVN